MTAEEEKIVVEIVWGAVKAVLEACMETGILPSEATVLKMGEMVKQDTKQALARLRDGQDSSPSCLILLSRWLN